jgi:hypothetical protein
MPFPSHPPWLDHSNYTWRRVQPMNLWSITFFIEFKSVYIQIIILFAKNF